MKGAKQIPHIVILPAPGMGHLIPLVEFAKRFVLYHDFNITFTIPTIEGSPTNAQKEILDSLPKCINTIFLSPVNLDDLSKDTKVETRIYLTILRSLPSLHEALKVLTSTTPIAALVVDLFGTDAFDVARQFNLPSYIFFPSTAMVLSLFLHLPKLDESHSCEYRELPEPVKLPGCVPIHGKELIDSLQDRQSKVYTWTLYHSKRFKLADGILLNSFIEMEAGAIKALKESGDPSVPPIFPIGPLTQDGSRDNGADISGCLRWLNNQPIGSVLFVSFGSGGALSQEQLNELALGLELSGQRFLWVVKSPNTTYLGAQSAGEDPLTFLPKGFLERTKGRGLVVPSWAPQIQVLSHVSTGGFVTHCGWNSTLESIVHGVPLIAWPLHAEQKMNAVSLVEDLKVALRPKVEKNGIVGRVEVSRVVKCLLERDEGKSIQKRMRMLKDTATKVLSEEGSSRRSLSEVAHRWKSQVGL
ncbi:hydroquinone glucosyltransferase-like [Telopea speciosissima]|uniref:hydroquinone glucosyltransferase-like n=1 Tax=Telopea speciosissima TaxID=54955 RepID=UPI001CC74CB1|nr:hydroquinone glucosyltransferase-like [Telopea speciosissima]